MKSKSKVLNTIGIATLVLSTTFSTAFAATNSDIFFSKHFDPSQLKNGAVLQQNPYVVVTTPTGLDNDAGDYVYVLEFVGQENDPVAGESTYWKGEQVSKSTGDVMAIAPIMGGWPVSKYPDLAPPKDGQGVNFGTQQPTNTIWATEAGLNTTPIPNWNPTVKGNNPSGFSDVPDSNPDASYITDLHNKGLISGTGNGNYSPNDPLTRAQFAKLIVSVFGVPMSNASLPFTDIPSGDNWAVPYIQAAYKVGITVGTSATTFNPDTPLKREEAATMVWRWLSSHGVSPASNADSFQESSADSWAQEAVKNIRAYGLQTGGVEQSSYEPRNVMNRGSAAALFDLSMKKLGK